MGLVALILGIVAWRRASAGTAGGKPMAVIGTILGGLASARRDPRDGADHLGLRAAWPTALMCRPHGRAAPDLRQRRVQRRLTAPGVSTSRHYGGAVEDEVDRLVEAWQRERPDLDVAPLGVLSRVTRLARHLDRARRQAFAEHTWRPGSSTCWPRCVAPGAPYELLARRAAHPHPGHLGHHDQPHRPARGARARRPAPGPRRPARGARPADRRRPAARRRRARRPARARAH